MAQITINTISGSPPYNIYVCDVNQSYCELTLTGVTSVPPSITLTTPSAFTYSPIVLIKIIDSSGSTQFGDTLDDTHVFSGSLYLISSQSVYRPNISPGTNDFILFVDSGSGELTYKNTIDGGSF